MSVNICSAYMVELFLHFFVPLKSFSQAKMAFTRFVGFVDISAKGFLYSSISRRSLIHEQAKLEINVSLAILLRPSLGWPVI